MNPKLLFVLGVIGAVVVVGVALSTMGGTDSTAKRHFRGRAPATTPPAGAATASPGAPATATATTPATAGGPNTPGPATPAAATGAGEGRVFRPGETHGATKDDAAKGATPFTAPKKSAAAGTTYTVAAKGESIYAVAQKMLGDAMRWREVYDANRAAIEDPDRIPGGTVLRMPDGADGAHVRKAPGIGDGVD